jgi:hypothetical protein
MVEQFGFVAVLDALGVSNYKIDEARKFIENKNALISELKEKAENIRKSFTINAEGRYEFPEMTISTFGDTLVICWPTGREKAAVVKFPAIAEWLQSAIVFGLKREILLRGSISIGDYIIDNGDRTVLGPAIADAHAWSEEANWFGIILTPYCQIYLGSVLENRAMIEATKVNNDILCVKYDVPLRDGKKEMYAISWPFFFMVTFTELPGPVTLSILLTKFSIPKGMESKYENSIQFFNFYENSIYPAVNESVRKMLAMAKTGE